MSLIEEALRKHRAESGQTTPPTEAASAPDAAPPPLPAEQEAAVAAEPAEPSRKPWALLVGLLAVVLIALLVGGWFFYQGYRVWKTKGIASTPVSITPPVSAPETAPTPVEAALPRKETNVNAAATAQTPVVAAVEGKPTGTVAEATSGIRVAPAPGGVQGSRPVPTNVVSVAPARAPVRVPVVWPHLSISGLIDAQGKGGVAIINGQMANVGDVVEGVKIVAVAGQSVQLSYLGETKTLKAGDTTN